MAISNLTQVVGTEAQCNSLTNNIAKVDCLKLLRDQYKQIVDINTEALNSDASNSGSYAILAKFKAQLAACPQNNVGCSINAGANIATTEGEIAVREKNRADANQKLKEIDIKIATLESSPAYIEDVKTKKTTRTIIWVVVAIVVIAIGIWAYRKYKK